MRPGQFFYVMSDGSRRIARVNKVRPGRFAVYWQWSRFMRSLFPELPNNWVFDGFSKSEGGAFCRATHVAEHTTEGGVS